MMESDVEYLYLRGPSWRLSKGSWRWSRYLEVDISTEDTYHTACWGNRYNALIEALYILKSPGGVASYLQTRYITVLYAHQQKKWFAHGGRNSWSWRVAKIRASTTLGWYSGCTFCYYNVWTTYQEWYRSGWSTQIVISFRVTLKLGWLSWRT